MATRTRKPETTFKVQSQLVTIHNRAGGRIRDARKGKWRTWQYYRRAGSNMADAIRYVTRKMLEDRVGGIVVIRQYVNGHPLEDYTKVYQAKWGTDNRPFLRFEGLVGEYWMRRLPTSLIKRLRQIRAS